MHYLHKAYNDGYVAGLQSEEERDTADKDVDPLTFQVLNPYPGTLQGDWWETGFSDGCCGFEKLYGPEVPD